MCKLYCFFTGFDNAQLCQRDSDRLADKYELYGNPGVVSDNDVRMVG